MKEKEKTEGGKEERREGEDGKVSFIAAVRLKLSRTPRQSAALKHTHTHTP